MTIFDLVKATVVCGSLAFLIYSFPAVGQGLTIGGLAVLWLIYAHSTLRRLRRR